MAFVSARKPPITVLVHNQGYYHQANSTANMQQQEVTSNTCVEQPSHLPAHVQNIQTPNRTVSVQPSAASLNSDQTSTHGPNSQTHNVQGDQESTCIIVPTSHGQVQNHGTPVQHSSKANNMVQKMPTDLTDKESVCKKNVPFNENTFLASVPNIKTDTNIEASTNTSSTYSTVPQKADLSRNTYVNVYDEILGRNKQPSCAHNQINVVRHTGKYPVTSCSTVAAAPVNYSIKSCTDTSCRTTDYNIGLNSATGLCFKDTNTSSVYPNLSSNTVDSQINESNTLNNNLCVRTTGSQFNYVPCSNIQFVPKNLSMHNSSYDPLSKSIENNFNLAVTTAVSTTGQEISTSTSPLESVECQLNIGCKPSTNLEPQAVYETDCISCDNTRICCNETQLSSEVSVIAANNMTSAKTFEHHIDHNYSNLSLNSSGSRIIYWDASNLPQKSAENEQMCAFSTTVAEQINCNDITNSITKIDGSSAINTCVYSRLAPAAICLPKVTGTQTEECNNSSIFSPIALIERGTDLSLHVTELQNSQNQVGTLSTINKENVEQAMHSSPEILEPQNNVIVSVAQNQMSLLRSNLNIPSCSSESQVIHGIIHGNSVNCNVNNKNINMVQNSTTILEEAIHSQNIPTKISESNLMRNHIEVPTCNLKPDVTDNTLVFCNVPNKNTENLHEIGNLKILTEISGKSISHSSPANEENQDNIKKSSFNNMKENGINIISVENVEKRYILDISNLTPKVSKDQQNQNCITLYALQPNSKENKTSNNYIITQPFVKANVNQINLSENHNISPLPFSKLSVELDRSEINSKCLTSMINMQPNSVYGNGNCTVAKTGNNQESNNCIVTYSLTTPKPSSDYNNMSNLVDFPVRNSNSTALDKESNSVITGPVVVTHPLVQSTEKMLGHFSEGQTVKCMKGKNQNTSDSINGEIKQFQAGKVSLSQSSAPILQLPAPSLNCKQLQPIIPNRLNVPILNNNYLESGNAASLPDDTLTSQSEPRTRAPADHCSTTNSGAVHSDSINNNNELFNQVANLNNNDYSARQAINDKTLCTKTCAQNQHVINGPRELQNRACVKKVEKSVPSAISSFTVLNVPMVNRCNKVRPSPERQSVSKIDLLTARRHARRAKRMKLRESSEKKCGQKQRVHQSLSDSSSYTSSDSEWEDEQPEVDLWIRSGPPSEPQYTPKKLNFLKIFGLTTPVEKNGK